jgi:hypothetical protein
LTYLGTATLPESYDNLLPDGLYDLMKRQDCVAMSEQIRDYGCNQSFRRDLYVKGKSSFWVGDLFEKINEFLITVNKLKPRPAEGEPYKVQSACGETLGDWNFYSSILNTVDQDVDGVALSALIKDVKNPNERSGIIQAVSMLIFGGWLMPSLPMSNDRVVAGNNLNRAMARAVSRGAPYRHAAVTGMGGALPMSHLEWLIYECKIRGVDRSSLPEEVFHLLKKANRNVLKNRNRDESGSELNHLIEERIKNFNLLWTPLLERFGSI